MIALAKHLSVEAPEFAHRAIALQPEAYPLARVLARQAGMDTLVAPEPDNIRAEIMAADIVHLHYWNNPSISAFVKTEWPAMRLLAWFKILGRHAPQVIGPHLLEWVDHAVATTPATLDLPAVKQVQRSGQLAPIEVIPGITDPDRLRGIVARPHSGFNVGYVGTVNFSKMHPRFVPMSAAVRVPGIRFIACGPGAVDPLRDEAAALGAAERFEWRGFVENIRPVLEILDVFGYPLCADTYATSEKSLQEAMGAGIPPVVFPHGGVRHLVQHGQTGLVVHSEREYAEAIEYLHHAPEERARLGANAREWALSAFDGTNVARRFASVYGKMLADPKRTRIWSGIGSRGASEFAETVAGASPEFSLSIEATDPSDWRAADLRIAEASPLLSAGEGGVFHFRNQYPGDPFLRLWAGLILLRQGRRPLAVRELESAVACGIPFARVAEHIGTSAPAEGR